MRPVNELAVVYNTVDRMEKDEDACATDERAEDC